jgi:hypothetical protein
MPTKSKKPGKNTDARVLSISPEGLWLLVGRREYFLTHREFPWFRGAKVSAVLNLTLPSPDHLYWPDLDVDLHLDSLANPAKYPVLFAPPAARMATTTAAPKRRPALATAGR